MPGDSAAQPPGACSSRRMRVVGDFLQMRGVSQTGGTVTVQRRAGGRSKPAIVITRGDEHSTRPPAEPPVDRRPRPARACRSRAIWSASPTRSPQVVPHRYAQPNGRNAPNSATVTWRGGLDFNGQVFRFNNEIVIDAKEPPNPNEGTTRPSVTGQQLEVVLDQAIDFARPETDGEDSSTAGGCLLRQCRMCNSQTVAGGQLVSRDSMQSKRSASPSIRPPASFTATGPGVVRSTRRGCNRPRCCPAASMATGHRRRAPSSRTGHSTSWKSRSISGIRRELGATAARVLRPRGDTLRPCRRVGIKRLAVPARTRRAPKHFPAHLPAAAGGPGGPHRAAAAAGWNSSPQGNTVAEGLQLHGPRHAHELHRGERTPGDGRRRPLAPYNVWRRTDTGEESSAVAARKVIFFNRRTSAVIRVQDVTSFDLSESRCDAADAVGTGFSMARPFLWPPNPPRDRRDPTPRPVRCPGAQAPWARHRPGTLYRSNSPLGRRPRRSR